MNDHQMTMLMQMIEDGVSMDGLCVEPDGETFRVRVNGDRFRISSKSDLEERLAPHGHLVSNWYYWEVDVQRHGSAKRAFLRWLEKSDRYSVKERYERMNDGPLFRSWGELSISIRLNEKGERIYEVTHQADRSKDLDELEVHVDPLNARWISKYDEEGEYRPLKGAPSLQRGWVFPGLKHEKLLKTVDYFYPASVVNWFFDREDRLDVTHYRDAAKRHTGMFDVIEQLDANQLRTVTEACCTDDNCLKRRRWEETADKKIDVPPGKGRIPCREPCQVLINRAREQVKNSHSSGEQ